MRAGAHMVFAFALWLTACGQPDLCTRLDNYPFAAVKGNCTVSTFGSGFFSGKCKAAIASCTSEERDALAYMMDCVEAVPYCTPALQVSWHDEYNTCAAQASVSSACSSAFGP